jgi:hypothetical protein
MATERLLLLAPADLSSCSKRFILYTPAFMGPLDADPNDVGLGSRRRLRSQSVAACLRCPCGAGAAPKVASCAWPQSRWASGHQFLFRRGPRSCGLADAERPGTPPPRSSAAIVAANRVTSGKSILGPHPRMAQWLRILRPTVAYSRQGLFANQGRDGDAYLTYRARRRRRRERGPQPAPRTACSRRAPCAASSSWSRAP